MFEFYNTEYLKTEEIFLKLNRVAEENPEKNYLPAYYFKICRISDNTEMGICDLRIGYNKGTYYGGNIGYGIEEKFRGNHFAGKACLLLFKLAIKHKMDYLYITCNPDNIASRKTCEYAGGVLEKILDLPEDNDMYKEGERQKCIYKFSFNQK